MNFNVKSSNPSEHIIIANGLLMGDIAWQNALHATESRILYRNDLMVAIQKGASNE